MNTFNLHGERQTHATRKWRSLVGSVRLYTRISIKRWMNGKSALFNNVLINCRQCSTWNNKKKQLHFVSFMFLTLRVVVIIKYNKQYTFSKLIFWFMMSSTLFEPKGSFSGRQLYMKVWYNLFYMHQYKPSSWWNK